MHSLWTCASTLLCAGLRTHGTHMGKCISLGGWQVGEAVATAFASEGEAQSWELGGTCGPRCLFGGPCAHAPLQLLRVPGRVGLSVQTPMPRRHGPVGGFQGNVPPSLAGLLAAPHQHQPLLQRAGATSTEACRLERWREGLCRGGLRLSRAQGPPWGSREHPSTGSSTSILVPGAACGCGTLS